MASIERLAARVVMPVLDLRYGQDREATWTAARQQRDLGVSGFIVFGGDSDSLRRELDALRADAPAGLIIGADLERGVAQQVRGATRLPSAVALGATGSVDLAERMGRELGRGALEVGIDWILGPVLDLADEPENPIVGTRSFGEDPEQVAALGSAFIAGVQQAGALACAKHFPGHGGTTADSHEALPVVDHGATRLRGRDLLPFQRAIQQGVATVMSAHVAYPSLSGSRLPATLEPGLVNALLRDELGFEGLLVTDALIMDGVRPEGVDELQAGVRALEAGCDLLLFPSDTPAQIEAVAAWARRDPANAARLREAVGRIDAAQGRVRASRVEADPEVGYEVQRRAVCRSGPEHPPLAAGESVGVLVLDDDGVPSLGHELVAELEGAGVEVSLAVVESGASAQEEQRWRLGAVVAGCERLVAVVGCQVRAWKGRPGLDPELADLLRDLPGERLTVVGACGPFPLQGAVPAGAQVVLVWDDDAGAQRAAAAVLLGAEASGRAPVTWER